MELFIWGEIHFMAGLANMHWNVSVWDEPVTTDALDRAKPVRLEILTPVTGQLHGVIMFLGLRLSHEPPTQSLAQAAAFDIPTSSFQTHPCYDQLHLFPVLQTKRPAAIFVYMPLKGYFPMR